MGLTAVDSSRITPLSNSIQQHQLQKRNTGEHLPQKLYTVDACLVSEYYSSKSISFDYISKDGDTVSFSMESVEYAQSILEIAAEGDKDDIQQVIEYIKENYQQMKKELLKSFLESVGVDITEDDKAEGVEKVTPLEIPEYWNAENTSQRIFEFAVSFYGVAGGSGEEFLSTIKAAIEEGFEQARALLGELPVEISGLIDTTYSLTMEKLDTWAYKQGITAPSPTEEAVA
ncbi:MAG: DUF5610 domain-containing protein [Chitinispirillaceae bacterium]|nr:DUF5610 domain-containing protein [Chitinispirillaceae bacterium]